MTARCLGAFPGRSAPGHGGRNPFHARGADVAPAWKSVALEVSNALVAGTGRHTPVPCTDWLTRRGGVARDIGEVCSSRGDLPEIRAVRWLAASRGGGPAPLTVLAQLEGDSRRSRLAGVAARAGRRSARGPAAARPLAPGPAPLPGRWALPRHQPPTAIEGRSASIRAGGSLTTSGLLERHPEAPRFWTRPTQTRDEPRPHDVRPGSPSPRAAAGHG